MALWDQLQKLESRYLVQVDQLYSDAFPMDIRQYLSNWIESQDWDVVASSESLATVHFHGLLSQLDDQYCRFAQENNFLLQHNIRKIKRNLLQRFQADPTGLAILIGGFLREERRILESVLQAKVTSDISKSNTPMEKQGKLDNKIIELKKSVQEEEQHIKALEDLQDDYDFKRKTLQSIDETDMDRKIANNARKQDKLRVTQMFITLKSCREAVMMDMTTSLQSAEEILVALVTEEVPDWRHRQQMVCIGGPPNACLDQLQSWFTAVAECLQQVRQQIRKLQELSQKLTYDDDPFTLGTRALEEHALRLFHKLLSNALVVERQPCMPSHPQRPQVLRTGVQFTVKVRVLVKLQEFNCQLMVKASFDKDVAERDTIRGFRNFNLLGTTSKVLNMEESNGCLAAEFRHLTLKEQRAPCSRTEGPLTVSEELHLLTFDTQLVQPGLCVDLMTTSLPLVVISNLSQSFSAWASILWYNMLCSDPGNLSFFLDPPQVTWGQLSEVLSWQFTTITKRGLNSDQLSMLGKKLIGSEALQGPDSLIPWTNFIKGGERQFHFWQWMEGTLDLIKNHLLCLWNDGYIMGFLSKEQVKDLLKDERPGTFLLRFSESCRDGGITITWVERSDTGEPETHSVKPYTKRDLKGHSFPDIIHNYKIEVLNNLVEDPLVYLYPDIPKDTAFGPYYSEAQGDKGLTIDYLNWRRMDVVRPPPRYPDGSFLSDWPIADLPVDHSDSSLQFDVTLLDDTMDLDACNE